jgi:hypothetical protein
VFSEVEGKASHGSKLRNSKFCPRIYTTSSKQLSASLATCLSQFETSSSLELENSRVHRATTLKDF